MEIIEKRVKQLLGAAAGATAVLVLLGIIFLIMPGFIVSVIQLGLAITLVAIGVFMIAFDVSRRTISSAFGASVVGIFSLILGILVFTNPGILDIIPIVVGIVMVLASFFKLRLSVGLRHAPTNLLLTSLITNLVTFICGLVLIFAPQGATEAAIRIIGIIFIIDGISSMVDVIVLGNHVNDFKRAIAKMNRRNAKTTKGSKKADKASRAVEAEVVSDPKATSKTDSKTKPSAK